MRRAMPRSLVAAEAAIGVLVVHRAVALFISLRSGNFPALSILHLSWTIPTVIGIPFGCRAVWRLAYSASAVLAGVSVFGAALSLFLALRGHEDFTLYTIWYSCSVIYLFTTYYLLRRPAVINYFEGNK
jgi:hypothetical protein